MRREIIYFRILAMLTFLGLASCQTEELYVEKNHFGKGSGIKSSYLKGNEAKRVVEMLNSKLSEGTKIKVLSTNSNSMRTDSGVIDFNTILQVIDTLGIKNYTFKVVNHPDDDLKTFHNLVLTEKINELEATILKYEMTDSFAQNYYANLDDFNDFQGKIVASSILIQDPCIPVVVNYPSNTGSGSPDNPDPNNPVGSIPISSTGCTTISLSFVCTDCNSLFNNWDEYRGSVCGNGSYGLNIVVSYVQSISCRSADDPCNPSGSIGVLQPEIDCNSFDSRVSEVIDTEGGFVNDPIDNGGPTNKGITWKVWSSNSSTILGIEPTLQNLQDLTTDQAKSIYKNLYWDSVRCDEINDGDLRYLLFDFNVNSGGNAIKILKKTLNGLGYNLTINTVMDNATLDAINTCQDIVTLYNTYKQNRKDFYQEIVDKSVAKYLEKKPNATQQQINTKTQKRFLNGWMNRANKFLNKTSETPINVNC